MKRKGSQRLTQRFAEGFSVGIVIFASNVSSAAFVIITRYAALFYTS
ncbi:hypothetical protein NSP_28750 [Nodularia spumigena CCY9414]|nr:hypothetical protein NSP_28750 [Nodularia spumigena CCY9414]